MNVRRGATDPLGQRGKFDAAGSRVSMGETASSCRMRTVEEREAHAAAVAKAFCEPSEFIVLFAVARPVTYCNK